MRTKWWARWWRLRSNRPFVRAIWLTSLWMKRDEQEKEEKKAVSELSETRSGVKTETKKKKKKSNEIFLCDPRDRDLFCFFSFCFLRPIVTVLNTLTGDSFVRKIAHYITRKCYYVYSATSTDTKNNVVFDCFVSRIKNKKI